jgi:PKD domain
MRVPRILLLISLLAAGLSSQALLSVPAQQPNIVTIRPRRTASQPGVPEVKAEADPARVSVGEKVTFTLSPASVIKDPCYQVTLFFGDKDSQIMRQPQTVHSYQSGGNYTYSILVRPVAKCGTTATPTPTPRPTPFQIPDVRLILKPPSAEVNQSVTFVAELSNSQSLSARNFSYRFAFDDGSKTGWQAEPKATHSYSAPKTYRVYVDIGLPMNGVIKQLGGSKRQAITVTPNQAGNQNGNTNGNQNKNQNSNRPNDNSNGNGNSRPNENQNNTANGNSNTAGNLNANTNANANANSNGSPGGKANGKMNAKATPQASATSSASPPGNTTAAWNDWWNYLIFLPLLMLAGYKAVTFFLLPRPTFVPHATAGDAKASGLALDYQMDVDPNVDGAFNIDTAGGNLIKAKRTSDD